MPDIPTNPLTIQFTATKSQLDRRYNAGDLTIEAGQGVYLDISSQPFEWKLLSAAMQVTGDSGIAVNSASMNQPLAVAKRGAKINTGSVTQAGLVVVASRTGPGALSPNTDLIAGDALNILGYTDENNEIVLNPTLTNTLLT